MTQDGRPKTAASSTKLRFVVKDGAASSDMNSETWTRYIAFSMVLIFRASKLVEGNVSSPNLRQEKDSCR